MVVEEEGVVVVQMRVAMAVAVAVLVELLVVEEVDEAMVVED